MPVCEAAARAWKQETRHPWLRSLAERIRGSRARGQPPLPQGFHAMDRHLELPGREARVAGMGTIGDSIPGGAYIPVHKALARLAREHSLEAETKPLGERLRPGRRLYLLVFGMVFCEVCQLLLCVLLASLGLLLLARGWCWAWWPAVGVLWLS